MNASIRRGCIVTAILCFIGAYALTPSAVRSRSAPPVVTASQLRTRIPDAAPTVVVPIGDPFAPRVADDDPPVVERVLPPLDLAKIGPLPPNAGAFPQPAGAPFGLQLRAIALGTHPSAVIAAGPASSQLVGVGDVVDRAVVVSIRADGVSLSDGRFVSMPETRGR